jgi:hypothetical protein
MEKSKIKVISEFEVDTVKYRLLYPNVTITREANFKHRKAFTDALKNGFYTKKKLEIILQEGEINVIKNHISRRAELLKQYYDASILIEQAETAEQLEYLAEILKTYRDSFIQEDMSMNALFSNTAEQLAEDERINYLCYSLIRHEDNSLVWASYDDYVEDNDYTFIERCKYEVLKWDYSLGSEDTSNQPEEKALKKAASIREAAIEKIEPVEVTDIGNESKEVTPVKVVKARAKTPKAKKEKPSKLKKRRAVTNGESLTD